MNTELAPARRAVQEAVEALGFARSWLFECTPADSNSPEEGYLQKVLDADFVIWLVGSETTQPVVNEVHQCIAAKRRLLVFKLPSEDRDERTSTLLNSVKDVVKWQEVESISRLQVVNTSNKHSTTRLSGRYGIPRQRTVAKN